MRTYQLNPEGEKRYELECTNFECKFSCDSVIVVAWLKEYHHNLYCENCGGMLLETLTNYKPIPNLQPKIINLGG